MIFHSIDFHNVEEIREDEQGYRLYRFPLSLADQMDEGAERVSNLSTGIELRFKLISDKAVLKLRAEAAEEAQVAYIYFGSFQGGWYLSSKVILEKETEILIKRPDNMDILKKISIEQKLGFNPEVVRVVLPYGRCLFIGIEGDIEVPQKADYPNRTYLAYGSSITHGSLALAMPHTYPFQIAQKFSYDYLNLGMAGSARLEKPLAQSLRQRNDWDFMSMEIGINMIKSFDEETFEKRLKEFLAAFKEEHRPIFVTSIFGYQGELQERASNFREIVRNHAGDPLIFTDGLELLNKPEYVSQDLTHPSLEGIREITEKWFEIMNKELTNYERIENRRQL